MTFILTDKQFGRLAWKTKNIVTNILKVQYKKQKDIQVGETN